MRKYSSLMSIVLLLTISCAHPYTKKDMPGIVAMSLAAIADSASTHGAVSKGGTEKNPVVAGMIGKKPSATGLSVLAVAKVATLLFVCRNLEPDKRKWVFNFATLVWGSVALHNTQVNK